MKMNDLKSIWELQSKSKSKSVVRDSISLNNGIICYAGFINVSLNKMFQIEIAKSVAIHKNYLKRFHGVEIRVLESSESKKDITIILSDNDLLDVFILFIEDLIRGLELIDSENEAPLYINQKVDFWGKLFAKIKGNLLSKERQRGLYGELTFLNTILKRSSDHVKCVVSWTGPEGSNQDFNNELSAVEVKASKATKPSVNIASELQLDWTQLDNLFLYVIHIDELSNGIDTLEKLIKNIKYTISNNTELLGLFEDKLDCIGIQKGEEKLYNNIGFTVRSQRAYKVEEGFPLLTKDIIANDAVHNVKYQIDLTACESFEVVQEEVISEMI